MQENTTKTEKADTRFLCLVAAGIVIVLLFCYGAFFSSHPVHVSDDAGGYDQVAQSVLAGRGFVNPGASPLSNREPVYPLFLAGVYALFGHSLGAALLLQTALLVAMLVWLARSLTPRIGKKRAVAVSICTVLLPGVAAMAVGNLLTETVAISLFIAAYALLLNDEKKPVARFGLAGLLLGLIALTKFAFIFFAPGVALFIVLFHQRLGLLRPWRAAGLVLLGFLIPVSLWSLHNRRAYGFLSPIGGDRGGNEFFRRANKTTYSGKYIREYFVGSFAGDYIGRKMFPDYASAVEPFIGGTQILSVYNQALHDAKNPDAVRKITSQALSTARTLMRSHPWLYALETIPEIAKMNSPLLWHNAGDTLHLFAGTHPELPEWFKITAILAYRFFYDIVLCISTWALARFIKSYSGFLAYFPLLVILYTNGVYMFFDAYARYAMPAYPFYAIGIILGLHLLWMQHGSAGFVRPG